MNLEEEKLRWSIEMDKWKEESKRLSKIAQAEIKSTGKVNDNLMEELFSASDKVMGCGDKLVEIAEKKKE